jgi:hypothetical protein
MQFVSLDVGILLGSQRNQSSRPRRNTILFSSGLAPT